MVKKLLENKVLIINIIVSLIVLFLIILSQKHTCLIRHGYTYPWFNIDNCGRFPSFCYEYLFNNFLPSLLNVHPSDFRSGGGIGCLILSSLYFIICVLFANAFFINSEDKKNIFKRKEFGLIIILSFLLLSLPLGYLDGDYKNYFRLDDLATHAEYFFNYIPLFIYLYFFFYCVKNKGNIKLKKIHLFILIIFSFMTGAYGEITNLTAFFSSVIMLVFLFFFDKERLSNKNILYPLTPLFLGMIHYYVICNNFIDTGLRQHNLNFFAMLIETWESIEIFLIRFYFVTIKSKIVYWVIICLLSFEIFKKNDKTNNICVLFVLSCIFGYIVTNLLTVFWGSSAYGCFMFERDFHDFIQVNLLEWSIFVLLGLIYSFKERRNAVKIIFLLSIFIFGLILCITYSKINDEKNVIKKASYNINKYCLMYSTLGETAILPKEYLEIFDVFPFISFENGVKKDIASIKNKYIGAKFFLHRRYYLGVYKQNLKGVIFVDDGVAEKELDKRLELLDETKEDMNLPKGKYISFNNLYKKYKGKKFTSDELLKIEERKGTSPILTKAIAYAYYQEKEYDKSIELYKEYLKEAPNDFDANLNIGDMYTEKQEYEIALEYLNRLISIDFENLMFLYKILNIYTYGQKNKQKAIELCNKMISIDEKIYASFLNKALIYYYFGDKENAEKVLIESKKVDEELSKIWLKILKEEEDIFLKQKLLVPSFYPFSI